MKVWLILVGLLAFTPALRGEDLPPRRLYQGSIKPGIVINQENLPRYEKELKRLLPTNWHHWYLYLGVRKGRITMPVVKISSHPLSQGVREATDRYDGQVGIGEKNELENWTAGVPFPKPKNALELAWNSYPDISRAASHDDILFYAWFGMFREDCYEKHFCWELRKKKYMGRCDIPPIPRMPAAESKGILSKESIVVTRPHEVKGFIQMRSRYWSLDEGDDCYAYIPALRRLRRLTGADLTDPLLGSDCIPDDFEAWRQKLNPQMSFRVLEHRLFLVPRWYTKVTPYDQAQDGPCLQIDWELRPCFVLEIMINDPAYVYTKRVLYTDALPLEEGGTFLHYTSTQYDQKGRLWRANSYCPPYDNGKGFKNAIGYVYMNLLSNHYTVMYFDPPPEFPSLNPDEAFSVRGLLRRAR